MARLDRRQLLASVMSGSTAEARIVDDGSPQSWVGSPKPLESDKPFKSGSWHFFTTDEGRIVEAIADRMIPPGRDAPGGKDLGVADVIDRQLAGCCPRAEIDRRAGLDKNRPEKQGDPSPLTPPTRYRRVLGGLARYATMTFAGKRFVELDGDEQDKAIAALENGQIAIEGVDTTSFFTMLLEDVRDGYVVRAFFGGSRDTTSGRGPDIRGVASRMLSEPPAPAATGSRAGRRLTVLLGP